MNLLQKLDAIVLRTAHRVSNHEYRSSCVARLVIDSSMSSIPKKRWNGTKSSAGNSAYAFTYNYESRIVKRSAENQVPNMERAEILQSVCRSSKFVRK